MEELHKLLKDAGEGARLSQEYHSHYLVLDLSLKGESLNMLAALTANVVSGGWYSLTVTVFIRSATANKALEEKMQEMSGATDKSVAELKERIQGLEKELDNANELLSSSKLRGLWH